MIKNMTYKQEFRVRDLSTRNVLIFPTRAHIIRDIRDIVLQPGANQIIIDGFAPTIDEHSINVEGSGSATITEVSVDLLPNRDVYEEIYSSDSDDEALSDDTESDDEDEAMKIIDSKIKQMNRLLAQETEKINSVASRLKICEDYGATVRDNPPSPEAFEKLVKAYRDEREKIYVEHVSASAALEITQEELTKLNKQKAKLAKVRSKAQRKASKHKTKLQLTNFRKRAEIAKEKKRIKDERSAFWPKKVYKVTISIEPSSSTAHVEPSRPNSTRSDSSSVGSFALSRRPADIISLAISYITYEVSWSPRYDLSLNTINGSGMLEYAAELKNMTSETWRDAKVILSTSQTSMTNLSETIPTLHPWNVRLLKGGRNAEAALYSTHEIEAKRSQWTNTNNQFLQKHRWQLFGLEPTNPLFGPTKQNGPFSFPPSTQGEQWNQRGGKPAASGGLFGGATQANAGSAFGSTQGAPVGGSLFGAKPATQSLSGGQSANPAPQTAPTTGGLFGAPPSRSANHTPQPEANAPSAFNSFGNVDAAPANGSISDLDEKRPAPSSDLVVQSAIPKPTVSFEEGAWEENGMTTTYDLPGLKTLTPSNSVLKHKIAKIEFKNVAFEHVVIPKLRTVAFLKAKLRNMSKISLLRGPVGLNLDGSFLGQATFPRCSSGESLSLNLGVDPAIKVVYNKPEVRRSQNGIFSKEDSNVFLRSLSLRNTRGVRSVNLVVMDQVPISEEERLRVEVLVPRGLKADGEKIPTGLGLDDEMAMAQAARSGGGGSGSGGEIVKRRSIKQDNWGTADAELKKSGEVVWHVKLHPGSGVKLVLQYEAGFPSGETVVNA
ncbi:mucoidy inhibitor protein [Rutstroemia sp. NJR-2017a BVV2]|nr:mucoidy inhibitor protein [Rutstroemia sp. NJR-2017a BVV2]